MTILGILGILGRRGPSSCLAPTLLIEPHVRIGGRIVAVQRALNVVLARQNSGLVQDPPNGAHEVQQIGQLLIVLKVFRIKIKLDLVRSKEMTIEPKAFTINAYLGQRRMLVPERENVRRVFWKGTQLPTQKILHRIGAHTQIRE